MKRVSIYWDNENTTWRGDDGETDKALTLPPHWSAGRIAEALQDIDPTLQVGFGSFESAFLVNNGRGSVQARRIA